MKINTDQLSEFNKKQNDSFENEIDYIKNKFAKKGISIDEIIQKLADFQVAIPSWALGAGGTRFGRFSYGGEPSSLEQKLDDIGILHALTKTAGAVSLHIPWDIPEDVNAIKDIAKSHDIIFDAMNSNTFQAVSYTHLTLPTKRIV